MWPFDGTPATQGFNQNQGQAPMGQNPLVKPQRTSYGGNKPWLAGTNNFANMLTALQNMPKKPPGAPDLTQGSPGMGGMPAAPPDPSQGAPGAGGMPAAPVGGIPSPPPMPVPTGMPSAPPVPFGGMNGPGMGLAQQITSNPQFDSAINSALGPQAGGLFGGAFKALSGGNPFSSLFSQPPQGG